MKLHQFHSRKPMFQLNLFLCLILMIIGSHTLMGSSHREAPLISNDPLADNVDVYAFRSPDNPNTITLIATYVPLQVPHGGPNYYGFGENIRYEIHVDNDPSNPGDEVTYRFVFNVKNEDPSTFFNIRLGQQNLKTTYTLYKSVDGGRRWKVIVKDGYVPPTNIGPRSIEGPVGLATSYQDLMNQAITTASSGEKVFAGSVDDPFFVDLGGIFDLGNAPRQDGDPRDGLACFNVSALAIQVPIQDLLKKDAPSQPTSVLDPDYVIGVWASASRRSIRTFFRGREFHRGSWTQVSRLGMPLTNEAVIPIGSKDFWNNLSPYRELANTSLDQYFYNPELALYMDDDLFGGAVPAFSPLRIQRNSLGAFDFGNGQDGLFGLKGSDAVAGTALDDAVFGGLLLPGPGLPRSVDLWPIFHTGVPNFPPYQLATGKGGNPLAAGKPFIHNFLPNGGDMLRLNMAVPVTPRDDENFSSLGLIQAAVLGLLDPAYNTTTDVQFIPNMDGFPNGRRLEDDVTRIELQAVGGAVLAAIGLWYDDFDPASGNPVTDQLLGVLGYTTGVETNDAPFTNTFPYLAMPWVGTDNCIDNNGTSNSSALNINTTDLELDIETSNAEVQAFETFRYEVKVTNTSGQNTAGVTVSLPMPKELMLLGTLPSRGAYNEFHGRWDVGTLKSGETATIEVEVMAQASDVTITPMAEVASALQRDIDSKPGNLMKGSKGEDDEGQVTIQLKGGKPQIASSNNLETTSINRLYPIPAKDQINMEVNSSLEGNVEFMVYNTEGKMVKKASKSLNVGFNQLNLTVSDLPEGSYFIATSDKEATVKKQFLVIK